MIVLVDGRNVERSRWPNVASEELVDAVARGKEQRDKRRDIAERDARRQIDRAMKERRL